MSSSGIIVVLSLRDYSFVIPPGLWWCYPSGIMIVLSLRDYDCLGNLVNYIYAIPLGLNMWPSLWDYDGVIPTGL
jgi:hypothetical protein